MKFSEVLKRIKYINDKLYQAGLSLSEIDDFWARIISLIPHIANAEKIGKPIKVCKDCGHINIEPMKPECYACCPDSNYININPKTKTQ